MAVRIGTLTVSEPRAERIHSEYAAWWTDVELVPGVYDLLLDAKRDHVGAAIPAIITHESNAPHFGGVAMGPSTQRHTGQPTTFHWGSYAHALAHSLLTGSHPDVTLDPGVEPVRVDFMAWKSCGHREHVDPWLYARTSAERDAAYDIVCACPGSGMEPCHTYEFKVEEED